MALTAQTATGVGTRPDRLRRRIGRATVLGREVAHRSDGLIITRVTTLAAGDYYLVVEGDIQAPGDSVALANLSGRLGDPWRGHVLETDHYNHPHRDMPLTHSFRVHVVYRETPRALFWRPVDEPT